MSFSVSISPVLDDGFDQAVRSATIPADAYPESHALFAKGQEAVIALVRELPRFGSGAEVAFGASVSGHAVPDPPDGFSTFNSLAVSVYETTAPVVQAEAETEAA